jgi:hypothetical protein
MLKENTQRNKSAMTILLLALGFGSIFALGTSVSFPKADNQFINESIEGTYGFIESGTLGPPAVTNTSLLTAVGLIGFDRNGGCIVKETVNTLLFVGAVSRISTSCTYNVNSDGTGTMIVTYDKPFTTIANISIVVDDTMHEIRFIVTDPGVLLSGTAKRQ